ncbi:MAG: HNH endonuclease signature motif containing protein [Candidatus Nanopelagicales bacterium]
MPNPVPSRPAGGPVLVSGRRRRGHADPVRAGRRARLGARLRLGPRPIARQLAGDADNWRRFLTDHGRLIATGDNRYRPSDRLRELVTARDTVCTFPGCTIPSTATDLDHVANFDGANTTAANLHPACRRHHRIKTHGTWTAGTDPGGTGRIRWTSPTGHTYLQPPQPLWDTGPPGLTRAPDQTPRDHRPGDEPRADQPDSPWTLRYIAA